MLYQIQLQDNAVKSLKKIPEPLKTLLKRKIETLKGFSKNMLNIKALQGEYKGLYRLRVGEYRVLFAARDKMITILDVFTRSKGY